MSPVASRQVRLVGRDAELATAVAHVRAGGSVLFAGAAGVGKSRLADEVVRRLRPPKLVRIRATRASAGMPYGAFDHLLPRPPEEAVPGALGWVARAVAGPPGEVRLLLVDDAHALDPASAVVVHHLVTTGRTRVVMTLRCGVQPPDPMTALWKDEAVRRFDLSPFDESASAALLTAILRDAADPATERALYTMSGGNALLLRELVYAAKDTKALTGPPWRLDPAVPITTPRLLEVIEDRIGGLDAPLRTVLELLALAEPLTFDHLGALCGADIVEQCNTRELVTLADADGRWEVRLAHPLIGEAVRRRCGQVRAVRHSETWRVRPRRRSATATSWPAQRGSWKAARPTTRRFCSTRPERPGSHINTIGPAGSPRPHSACGRTPQPRSCSPPCTTTARNPATPTVCSMRCGRTRHPNASAPNLC
jgi:hypothetical protein